MKILKALLENKFFKCSHHYDKPKQQVLIDGKLTVTLGYIDSQFWDTTFYRKE